MLTIDLIIGILLMLLGAIVLIYLLYTLSQKQQVQIKMSPLYISEALATLIIGIFYVVCSCIIGTNPSHTITNSTSATSTLSQTTASPSSVFSTTEPTYDPIEEKALRDLYDPNNFYNSSFSSENRLNTNQLLDDFIKYYKESFGNTSLAYGNTIRKLIAINRIGKKIIVQQAHHHRQHDHLQVKNQQHVDFEEEVESIEHQEEMDMIDQEEEDCSMYDEIFFKYMMLVVSFVYGVISVINSAIECKSCSSKTVFAKKDDDNEAAEEVTVADKKPKYNCKSIMQVVLAWIVPVLYGILVTLTMKPNEVAMEFFEITHLTDAPSDIISIIEHPLNVSHLEINATQKEEMNAVIDKIYDIMHHIQEQEVDEDGTHEEVNFNGTDAPFDILETMNNLNGIGKNRSDRQFSRANSEQDTKKFVTTEEPYKIDGHTYTYRKCSLELMPIKLHTLIVFILAYFLTIFYVKVTQAKLAVMKGKEQEQVKILGKYILAFASLWLPSMLEIFMRTYLMETKPTVATDITLAIGNLTRIVANGINVRNMQKVVQKFNNVRPVSECV